MSTVGHFRALHHTDGVLLLPNAWDVGSARILAHLGFRALATTSSGAAAARGTTDGDLGLQATLENAAAIAGAVDVPVSTDFEDGFGEDPDGVAEAVGRACETPVAGVSIEDWDGAAIRDATSATDRVRAAVDAAAGALVVTARAENHFHGRDDLADTIERLVAYQNAGADVVYAPGLRTRDQLRAVLAAVEVPVNVVAVPGLPPVAELRELGVRRVSVGGSFAFAAYAALADAANELLDPGTYGFTDHAARGRSLTSEAFTTGTRS